MASQRAVPGEAGAAAAAFGHEDGGYGAAVSSGSESDSLGGTSSASADDSFGLIWDDPLLHGYGDAGSSGSSGPGSEWGVSDAPSFAESDTTPSGSFEEVSDGATSSVRWPPTSYDSV